MIVVFVNRGTGQPGDKVREVYQYWSMDGRFLAEHDPINFPDTY